MVKDGRDSIKRSMRPCFHNGLQEPSAIQKEKERKVFEKEIEIFHTDRHRLSWFFLFQKQKRDVEDECFHFTVEQNQAFKSLPIARIQEDFTRLLVGAWVKPPNKLHEGRVD